MRQLLILFFLTALLPLTAQTGAKPVQQARVLPPSWWVGMKNNVVQLMIYDRQIQQHKVQINQPGVKVRRTVKVQNPNYLFVEVEIAPSAKTGRFDIVLNNGGDRRAYPFELGQKPKAAPGQRGLNAADLIYLIMPDRFANGDESNDRFRDMLDTNCNRNNPFYRHGGDIQGIVNHLDYLQELGATALWLTPIIENDEPLIDEGGGRMQAGFHGYHFTDHYAIDKRFGTAETYRKLSDELHRRGMKLVQDAVYNHVSEYHWMYRDQPMPDWFNTWPAYTPTTHKDQPLSDPYGSEADRKELSDGWFTRFLPDLNQRNPYLARFLIQNAIWMTAQYDLDAWRIDTYKYNDLEFMNKCNQALLDEFPYLHIFGESWVGSVPTQAYYVRNRIDLPFRCNLPGTLDFQTFGAILAGLNEPFGWSEGISRLYQVLTEDFLYEDPMKNVLFLDNHDMDRFFSVIGEQMDKYKLGTAWLLTSRGIPQLYYGHEILMKNFKKPSDAEVRRDFPGGFRGDAADKFTATGRTEAEREAFNFVQKLAQYRKKTPALHSGKMMQFVPRDGIYVYFRYDSRKTVMIVLNTLPKAATLETARFQERLKGFGKALNVMTGELYDNLATLKLGPMQPLVLELR